MKVIRETAVTDSVLTASSVPESEPAWAAGTYAKDAEVRVGHVLYRSLVASNTANPATDDGTKWLEIGHTNRWRMFDGAYQGQTTAADEIVVTLTPDGRVDTLALFNVSAASARVVMTSAADGVVFDQTYSLVSPSGIQDWYAWYFEPIERLIDLTVEDLPPYADATLEVTLSAEGETVKCGLLVFGLAKRIGGTQFGASLGLTDYSLKKADEFGVFNVVQRAYSKRASFDVILTPGAVDTTHSLLASLRATRTLYIGDADYAATAVYGFFKDFSVVISGPTHAMCSLEIESVT